MQDIEDKKNNTEEQDEEVFLDEVDELKFQLIDLEDKLLRAVAESQNIRKMAEKEKTDILKYSISGFAKDVLSIRDNLKLALSSCNSSSTDTMAIVNGIELTLSEMDKILAKNQVTLIDALDKDFDPHFHQAIVELEDENKKPGTVIQIMQDGFMIYDRLLRPALVGVSKKK